MPKLTKRYMDSKKIGEKETVLWDDELKGFGLRVKPSGRKTFVIQYRNPQGRSRRMTLGTYGKMTIDEARKIARERFVEVGRGLDPVEHKAQISKAPIMSELTKRYLASHAIPNKKPRSIDDDRKLIDRFINPMLGHRKVADVTRKDIADIHHQLHKTPVQANHLRALLSKMFNLAELWGLRPDGSNPTRHVQRYKEKPRNRYLSPEELARLGSTLEEIKKDKSENPFAVAALELLIYTGARLNEILTLRWDYIHIDEKEIRLPDSKTGEKIIPLGQPAIEVLESLPRKDLNPHVIPGLILGAHLVGLPKIWGRIRKRAGLEDVRIHDLRHSFGSVAASNGLGLPIIGGMLGHRQAATTQRYAHLANAPLKAAADHVSGLIKEAMGKEPEKGKVLPMKK